MTVLFAKTEADLVREWLSESEPGPDLLFCKKYLDAITDPGRMSSSQGRALSLMVFGAYFAYLDLDNSSFTHAVHTSKIHPNILDEVVGPSMGNFQAQRFHRMGFWYEAHLAMCYVTDSTAYRPIHKYVVASGPAVKVDEWGLQA